MKPLFLVSVIATIALTAAGGASATLMNITIPDLHSSTSGWYGTQEDNEVEPGCITGQIWDLEAFYLNLSDHTLRMAGGWDFQKGEVHDPTYGYYIDPTGDIMIDVNGGALWGPDAKTRADAQGYKPGQIVPDTFGWDFAIHVNWSNMSYSVIDLNSGPAVSLQLTTESINRYSDPWIYVSGGKTVLTGGSGSYMTGKSDGDMLADYGTLYSDSNRPTHNVASVDIAWLGAYLEQGAEHLTTHLTYECGNDYMIGDMYTTGGTNYHDLKQALVVPEPSTLVLLGFGLMGVVAFRKRVLG
jgi:hypothetical protein